MSSLAALLLTYLNEEDAFWGMVTLIGDQKYAMHGEFHEFHPKRTAVKKFECILRHKQSFFRLQLIQCCFSWGIPQFVTPNVLVEFSN